MVFYSNVEDSTKNKSMTTKIVLQESPSNGGWQHHERAAPVILLIQFDRSTGQSDTISSVFLSFLMCIINDQQTRFYVASPLAISMVDNSVLFLSPFLE